ncbi:hypothetical protein L7F22_026461 [Adiantum nelumboides]|nr:hypothetical protein [Adiantum nelumboides]
MQPSAIGPHRVQNRANLDHHWKGKLLGFKNRKDKGIVVIVQHVFSMSSMKLRQPPRFPTHWFVDSRGCPLELTLLNYNPHCFEAGDEGRATATFYSLTLPLCCVQVMAGLGKLMLTYANSTKQLFLAEAEGEACLGELRQDETLFRCAEMASKFIAFRSPCTAFSTRAALVAQLNVVAAAMTFNSTNQDALSDVVPVSAFSHLQQTCGSRSTQQTAVECSRCSASFKAAVGLLNASLHDEADVCAGALLVGLASSALDDPVWTNSLFACASQDLDIHLPPASSHPAGSRKTLGTVLVITGTIIGTLVALMLLLMVSWRTTQRKKITFYGDTNPIALDHGSMQQMDGSSANFACSVGLYTFSLEEIVKATNHFDNGNLLGQGEAGKVFKGVLPSGQLMAVKEIAKNNKPHTFKTELVSLSKVRHAHLVALMGFCQSNDAYYLVYEYCSNGDLAKWLFVSNEHAQVLSWEQRVRIAVNTARGLWFLHNYPGGSIVHRDIKPTNILLNEHLEAKLSDFGLARLMEIDNSYVMTEVKGTTGYLDPEYMSMALGYRPGTLDMIPPSVHEVDSYSRDIRFVYLQHSSMDDLEGEKGYESFFGYRMDGNKEEGSSSEDRQPIPTAHEIGESSGQAEKALQVVTAATMFKQLMENPRFMEFIQSSSIAHQVKGSFGMPGTVFRGMQGMVPNPMYEHWFAPRISGHTRPVWGVTRQLGYGWFFNPIIENDTWTSTCYWPGSTDGSHRCKLSLLTIWSQWISQSHTKKDDQSVQFDTFSGFDERTKVFSFLEQFDKAFVERILQKHSKSGKLPLF